MKLQCTGVMWCLAMVPAAAMAQGTVEGGDTVDVDASIHIENVSGSVTIEAWDKPELWYRCDYERDVEGVDLDVSSDGGTVHLDVEVPSRRKRQIRADLHVRIPRGASLDVETVSARVRAHQLLGDVEIETVSGSVVLNATAGQAEIETVSGDVEVTGNIQVLHIESTSGRQEVAASGRELRMETVSGTTIIEGNWETIESDSTSGDITAKGQATDFSGESISGSVVAHGILRSAHASSCSGRVSVFGRGVEEVQGESISGRIVFEGDLRDGADIELSSKSGDIDLKLPGTTNASFELSTFSGRVSADNAPTPAGKRGPGVESEFTWGSGSAEVEVETFSGNITVRAE